MKDAVEGRPPPVGPRQREDGPQVVEGDVALRQGALQPGFLEGGPLLLQGPGTAQITLKEPHTAPEPPLFTPDVVRAQTDFGCGDGL